MINGEVQSSRVDSNGKPYAWKQISLKRKALLPRALSCCVSRSGRSPLCFYRGINDKELGEHKHWDNTLQSGLCIYGLAPVSPQWGQTHSGIFSKTRGKDRMTT